MNGNLFDETKKIYDMITKELKFQLLEFENEESFSKKLSGNVVDRSKLIVTFNDSLALDKKKIEPFHTHLLQIVSDWKGDLEKEIKITSDEELRVTLSDILKNFINNETMLTTHIKETSDLLNKTRLLLEAKDLDSSSLKTVFISLRKYLLESINYDKIIQSDIKKLEKIIESKDFKSSEMINYQNALKSKSTPIDSILSGYPTKFSNLSFSDRKQFLLRFLRTNAFNIQKTLSKKTTKLLFNAINVFLASNIDMARIEPFYNDNTSCKYNESITRLRNKGCIRHLRPQEFFTILNEYYKSDKIVHSFIMDDYYQKHIWLSCAVRKNNDKLEICYEPEKAGLVFENNRYISSSNPIIDMSLNIDFKDKDVGDLFGVELGLITVNWGRTDSTWHPVYVYFEDRKNFFGSNNSPDITMHCSHEFVSNYDDVHSMGIR